MLGLISCLLLLLALTAGTLRRPAIAVAAVLCLYGLKQWGQSSTAFFATQRTFMNIAVAVLVAIGMLANLRRHADVKLIPTAWTLTVALYTYAFLTVLWSPDVSTTLAQWSLQSPYVLMIACIAPLLVKSVDDAQIAGKWTLLIGTAICMLALFFGQWGLRGLRVSGDFLRSETNPLAIASLGGTICVIAMVSLVTPASTLKKLICITAALIGIAVILRSGSRGQLVAAVAAVVIGMPMAARRASFRSWLAVIITIVIVAQVGWWIWEELGVDSARWSGERSSQDAEGRFMMASTLISAAAIDPLKLLFGLGNSSAFYYVGFYPHIAPLEVLAEEGLLGFAAYCGIIISALRSAAKLAANAGTQGDLVGKHVVAVVTALFLFEWILTFKQGTLLSSVYVFAYAIVLGTLARASERADAATSSEVAPATETLMPVAPNLMH